MTKSPEWIAGFKTCLDLVKHRIVDANTLVDVVEILENIDAAVTEKEIDLLMKELLLT